jgi:hypothetical protein
MATIVASQELDINVDHRLFGLVDEEGQLGDRPPGPRTLGSFVSSNATMLYVDSGEDILGARLRLEAWDGPPTLDVTAWPQVAAVDMELPSGRFLVDEIAAGGKADVFRLPSAGRWHVRVAWRLNGGDDAQPGQPEGSALIQFWPA